MNINLEQYRVFYIVAKKGNITAASHELMISQPAISKTIKNLEDSLGGKLFVRNKKGVTLTNEGQEFFNYISKAMEYIDIAENKFKELINLEIGAIRIGVSTTLTKVFLLPYLDEFRKKYPNINITILTSGTKTLFERLNEGLLDIVIYNSPCNMESEFKCIPLKEIHGAFFCGSNLKDLTKKELSLNELNNYPLILQNSESNTRMFLDEFCSKNNCSLKESVNASSFNLALEFTKMNYGISFLTKEFVKDDINKTIFELNVKPNPPKRNIALAYKEKNGINFSTKKLIEILPKK